MGGRLGFGQAGRRHTFLSGPLCEKYHTSIYEIWHINCVSCFNAGHIFVDIFMIMHRTVMKFGMNIEAKHTNNLQKFLLFLFAK